MDLKELKKEIERIEIDYDYEEAYNNLYNSCINYDDSYEFDELFYNFINYDEAEEIAKQKIDNGGLARIACFLQDVDLSQDIFKLDGYENLQNVYKDDLELLKEEILDKIEELEEEE